MGKALPVEEKIKILLTDNTLHTVDNKSVLNAFAIIATSLIFWTVFFNLNL